MSKGRSEDAELLQTEERREPGAPTYIREARGEKFLQQMAQVTVGEEHECLILADRAIVVMFLD